MMNKERKDYLEGTGDRLTQAELDAGWHFCADWDYMLVGPDDPEMESCLCFKKEK